MRSIWHIIHRGPKKSWGKVYCWVGKAAASLCRNRNEAKQVSSKRYQNGIGLSASSRGGEKPRGNPEGINNLSRQSLIWHRLTCPKFHLYMHISFLSGVQSLITSIRRKYSKPFSPYSYIRIICVFIHESWYTCENQAATPLLLSAPMDICKMRMQATSPCWVGPYNCSFNNMFNTITQLALVWNMYMEWFAEKHGNTHNMEVLIKFIYMMLYEYRGFDILWFCDRLGNSWSTCFVNNMDLKEIQEATQQAMFNQKQQTKR